MKYIMFKDKYDRLLPVIFPDSMIHAEVADAICRAVRRGEVSVKASDYSCPMPIRAGFTQVLSVNTEGMSESLNMKSEHGDAQVINVNDYSKGAVTGMEDHIEKLLIVKSIELLLEQVRNS